jgi:UDP:flavonoid glycosyltransferase YjiC (YdhE family)
VSSCRWARRGQFPRFTDAFANFNDIHLALTTPEFSWPRSNWKHRNEFIGITRKVGVTDNRMPLWWNEVLEAKRNGRKIIAISVSSLDYDPHHLVILASEAFKDREDTLSIAAFVNEDPEALQYTLPRNARAARFIPMTELLPYVKRTERAEVLLDSDSADKDTGRCCGKQCRLRNRAMGASQWCSNGPHWECTR